tara:strand:- start:979 stop:1656 length:678 start_codon:yes stop_codon:yes gene_type:complete
MDITYGLTISIDDLHPEKDWGCDGDECVTYLEKLNKEFGCKFNLFIPSNYHHDYPLDKHMDWIKFWLDKDWVEISSHGHFHQCVFRDDIGEQEFLELNYEGAVARIERSMEVWNAVGYTPKGFRMPGWGCNQESAKAIGEQFDWVAAHDKINFGLDFGCKTFYGCDGINQSEDISIWDSSFMFQSHIAGEWNDNMWNEENYLHFREVLKYLLSEHNIQFKTISEL